MTNSNNPGFLSQSNKTPSAQLIDGTDFPHSGLFKALSQQGRGNFAIQSGAFGTSGNFSIAQSISSTKTVLTVQAGKIFRDGQLISVSGATFTAGTTPSSFDEHASTNNTAYFLLVANASGSLAIRGDKTLANDVPDYTLGDTIIAVITMANGGTANERPIQYITTDKTENHLSIGYDDSDTYTETMKVDGASGGTTITNSVGDLILDNTDTNDQIIARLGTDTTATGFEVQNNSAAAKFKVDGAGNVNLPDSTASRVLVTDASKNIVASSVTSTQLGNFLENVSEDSTPQLGGNLDVNGNSIVSSSNGDIVINPDGTGKVGVGTASPASKLHLSDGNASLLTNASNVSLIITDAEVPRIYFEDTGEGSGDRTIALSYLDENLKIQSVTDNGSAYDQENILVANRDGNVGIGTVPSQKLHVSGTIRQTGTTSAVVVADSNGDLTAATHLTDVEQIAQKVGADQSNDLATGWWTIAYIEGRDSSGQSEQRGYADFLVRDNQVSRHQVVRFAAGHHFGSDVSATLNLFNNTAYSTSEPIIGIRIKEAGIYAGAALQVEIGQSTNSLQCFAHFNEQNAGWILLDTWLQDSDNSGHDAILGYSTDSFSNFTAKSYIDLQHDALDASKKGGIATVGGLAISANKGGSTFNPVFQVEETETVINDTGYSDHDFRVESDTNTHMLFVDASADKVGIGKTGPTKTLDVAGTVTTSGRLNQNSAFDGSTESGIGDLLHLQVKSGQGTMAASGTWQETTTKFTQVDRVGTSIAAYTDGDGQITITDEGVYFFTARAHFNDTGTLSEIATRSGDFAYPWIKFTRTPSGGSAEDLFKNFFAQAIIKASIQTTGVVYCEAGDEIESYIHLRTNVNGTYTTGTFELRDDTSATVQRTEIIITRIG
tara:strand:- start:348 stop:3020 length:2673 start_codon:yes stop_codon:yes gene_type:complete